MGENVSFYNIYSQNITLGMRVRIIAGTKILAHYLDVSKPPFSFYTGEGIIGDNVFIGTKSLTVKPYRIGNNAVVAAGSIVDSDVHDNWIVGGVSAKKIGERKI